MALVVLAAAKGAPGVTTATAALAAVWPKPAILVEADPSGSDLQLLARTTSGRHLQGGQRGAGILGLATHGGNRSTLLKEPICQDSDLGVPVIIGPPHPRSAHAMGPAWQQVAAALAQLSGEGDYDVLVDAGRIDDQSMTLPLIHLADVVVLTARRNLRGIAHTRRVATIVEENMRLASTTAPPAVPRLLIVDDPATPKRVETQWPVAARGLNLTWSMLPMLTWDGDGAQSLFDAHAAHRDTSAFLASIRAVATELHDLATRVSTGASSGETLDGVLGGTGGRAGHEASSGVPNGVAGAATMSGNHPNHLEVTGTASGAAASLVPAPSTSVEVTSTAVPASSDRSAAAPTGLTPLSSSAPSNFIPDGVVWPPVPPSRRRTRAGQSSDFGTALDATLEGTDQTAPGQGGPGQDETATNRPRATATSATSTDSNVNSPAGADRGTSQTSEASRSGGTSTDSGEPEPDPRPQTANPDRDHQLMSTGAGPR